MNKLRIVLFFFIFSLFSPSWAETSGCYSAYDYQSLSKVGSLVQGLSSKDNINVSLSLYLKVLDNKTKEEQYTQLVGMIKDVKIESDDNQSVIANAMQAIFSYPFIVTVDDNNILQAVNVPPENRKNRASVVGVLQNIFIPSKIGEYFELTAEGLAKVKYTQDDEKIKKQRLAIYNRKKEKIEAFNLPESHFVLAADKNDCIKIGVNGTEKYQIISAIDHSQANGYLDLKVKYNKNKRDSAIQALENIDIDMSKWHVVQQKKQQTLTEKQKEQLAQFLSKELNHLERREDKLAIINNNLQLLQSLNALLLAGLLDDHAVMDIMWGLGVIDNRQTVTILNNAIIDTELSDENRFRALRGLAMTETTLSTQEVDQLTLYLDQAYRKSSLDRSIAMQLGELAAKRLQTDPEQTALIEHYIEQQISDSASYGTPDRIAIHAARNMQDSASDRIVDTVVNTLADNNTPDIKAAVAGALAQFSRRSDLVPVISASLENATESQVKANFIHAYTRHGSDSVDFVPKMKRYVMDRQQQDVVREAAVAGILKSGYGKNEAEKKDLKALMINEKDSSIIKAIATAIYAPAASQQ